MRIFLTGGTGYTGSAVLEAFVRAGHTVDARNYFTATPTLKTRIRMLG